MNENKDKVGIIFTSEMEADGVEGAKYYLPFFVKSVLKHYGINVSHEITSKENEDLTIVFTRIHND